VQLELDARLLFFMYHVDVESAFSMVTCTPAGSLYHKSFFFTQVLQICGGDVGVERIFVEVMASDSKLKASREGSK